MELTKTERQAIIGLQIRQDQLNREGRDVAAEIESRLGIPIGSLSKTYVVDFSSGRVVVAQPPGEAGNPARGPLPLAAGDE